MQPLRPASRHAEWRRSVWSQAGLSEGRWQQQLPCTPLQGAGAGFACYGHLLRYRWSRRRRGEGR